jgi:hypothetical protein
VKEFEQVTRARRRASARQFPGDAGLPPIRQFDRHVGLARPFAGALDDPGTPTTNAPPGSRRFLASGPALVLGPAG